MEEMSMEHSLEYLCEVASHLDGINDSGIISSILQECPPMLASSSSRPFSFFSDSKYHFRLPRTFLCEDPSKKQLKSILSLAKLISESKIQEKNDYLLHYLLDFLQTFLFIEDNSIKFSSFLSDFFPSFFTQFLSYIDQIILSYPSTLKEVGNALAFTAIECIHKLKHLSVHKNNESETPEPALSKLFLHSLSYHPISLLKIHGECTLTILIQAIVEDYECDLTDSTSLLQTSNEKPNTSDIKALLKASLQGKYSSPTTENILKFSEFTNHSSHNSTSSFSSIPYSIDFLNCNTNDKLRKVDYVPVESFDNVDESFPNYAISVRANITHSWRSVPLRQVLLQFCSRLFFSPEISKDWVEKMHESIEKIREISTFHLKFALILLKFHHKDEFDSAAISKSDVSSVFKIAMSASDVLIRLCTLKFGNFTCEKCVSFLLDIAESASVSAWRKTSACQQLFHAVLTSVIDTCHFDPQSVARSSLLRFRHLVFSVCSQTEEKKGSSHGSKPLYMHDTLTDACCSLIRLTWKIDSSSVTSFLLSLAKCVNEKVDDDHQLTLLFRLRTCIIPMLVKALTFLKQNSVTDVIMNLLLEGLEGEASSSSPFRNQLIIALSQLATIGYEQTYKDAVIYLIMAYKQPLSSIPVGLPISFSPNQQKEMDKVLPNAFLYIAHNIKEEKVRIDYRHRLLSLASDIGLVVESRSGSDGGRVLGSLLPAIAVMCKEVNPLEAVDHSTLKLYKNLWYYIALYGLVPPLPGGNKRVQSRQSLPLSTSASGDSSISSWRAVCGPYQWKDEWISHVLDIASCTPPLVLSSVNWLEDEMELNALHNPGSRRGNGNDKAASLQRHALSLALGSYVGADALSSISGVKATYLLAVVFLEVLRLSQNGGMLKSVTAGDDSTRLSVSAMRCTMKYLNSSNLLPAVTSCLSSIALLAFDSALSSLKNNFHSSLFSGINLDNASSSHACFLISSLKPSTEHVRDLSATMLSRLRSSHAQVLWNSSCIDALLDLISDSPASVDSDTHSANTSVVFEWLTCALLLAPLTTQSLLQEKLQHSSCHRTAGLLSLLARMNLELPAVFLILPIDASKSDGIMPAVNSNLNLLSACIYSSSMKSQYVGEVNGMKQMFTNLNTSSLILSHSASFSALMHGVKENLARHFVHLMQNFVSSVQKRQKINIVDFQETCLRAAALIISEPGHLDYSNSNSKSKSNSNSNSNDMHALLRLLCWSPIRVFTPESLTIGVFVWSWLISTKPSLEVRLLSELIDAWVWMMHEKRGIFCTQPSAQGPLSLLRPQLVAGCREDPPDFDPVDEIASHRIWLSFFNDRLEVNSHGCHEQLSLFLLLLQQTFHSHHHFTSHPSAMGTFFYLLNFAVKFVNCQKPHSSNSNSSMYLLSHRIYRSAFHWFSFKPCYFEIKSNSYLNFEFELSSINEFLKFLLNESQSNNFHSFLLKFDSNSNSNSNLNENVNSSSNSVKITNFRHPVWHNMNTLSHNFHKQIMDLLFLLCSNEVDRLENWAYPLKESSVQRLKTSVLSSEKWKEYVKTSWMIDKKISIFLIDRFPYVPLIQQEVTSLIQNNVAEVRDIPEAIPYFLTPEAVASESPNLLHLPYCASCSITSALHFLTPPFKGHERVMAYVLRVLENYPPHTVTFFMPQLIQALRYDYKGLVEEYLLHAAKKSILFSHILIWQLQGEEAPSEDDLKYHKDPSLKQTHNMLWDIVPRVRQKIISSFSPENKIAFDQQFDFFNSVTSISGILKPIPKDQRRAAIRPELEKIPLTGDDVYLPTHPSLLVKSIVVDSGIPLQSAEKVPIMVSFSCVDRNDHSKTSIQACIFKVGDDCRQDVLALQVISLLQDIYKAVGLGLYLFPYGVLPTGFERGIIEVVPNSRSRNQMGEVTDGGLFEIFEQTYGPVNSPGFETARKNFIISSAGYAVASLLLQPKDRHNGNLLLDSDGHLVHIDFGFILETSPGGNMRFESANFKLSHEMTQLLDPSGIMKSDSWDYFVSLCVKGYLAARCHMESILNTVLLMVDSGLPCFSRGDPIGNLRRRFHLEVNDREAANFMIATCADAYNKWSTSGYDLIQYLQQGIEK